MSAVRSPFVDWTKVPVASWGSGNRGRDAVGSSCRVQRPGSIQRKVRPRRATNDGVPRGVDREMLALAQPPSRPAMATTFTSDILPLFRAGDVACMKLRGVRLDDADWMCNAGPGNGFEDHGNARSVFASLTGGSMPPDAPWTPLQLQTYSQWMLDGFLKP